MFATTEGGGFDLLSQFSGGSFLISNNYHCFAVISACPLAEKISQRMGENFKRFVYSIVLI